MSKQPKCITLRIDPNKANGQETAEIAVNWRGRYLAVHRALSNSLPIAVDKKAGYVITHIPTGLTVHKFHHFNARLAPVKHMAEQMDVDDRWDFIDAKSANLAPLRELVMRVLNP